MGDVRVNHSKPFFHYSVQEPIGSYFLSGPALVLLTSIEEAFRNILNREEKEKQ
jgi:hypothetical protein